MTPFVRSVRGEISRLGGYVAKILYISKALLCPKTAADEVLTTWPFGPADAFDYVRPGNG